jgi:PAS domain S-box-containing protein
MPQDRSKKEEYFAGTDRFYRVLFEDMNEGAAVLLPEGSVLYCNKSFAEMLKMQAERVIGTSIKDCVALEDQETFEHLLRRGEHDSGKAEINFSLTDGTFVPVYCSVSPVQIDELRCLCLVATDLTEQRHSEEIVASENFAKSILEQAVDVIVVTDEKGKIVQASRAADALAGANVLHQSFEEAFPLRFLDGTDLSCSLDEADARGTFSVTACLGGRTVQNLEVEFQRADGKKFDLLISAGPLRDSQQRPLGCVFTLSDITDRKRAEEGLRRNEEMLRQQAQELEQQLIASGRLVSLGEITASMAHEFNNPLGIIMGFAQDLLGDADPSSPAYRSLRIIDEETRRCEKIIQELLQFARPKSTDLCATDVKQAVEKTLGLVSNRLYKQKIESNIEIEEALPKIYADPQELEQVLVNLYLNAIDAMSDGGTLTVRARPIATAKEVVISVSDTGLGISPEDLGKIFQPFFTAKKKRGLGLGLPICQRIIKNHNGRIAVTSPANEGTTFDIYLPVVESTAGR